RPRVRCAQLARPAGFDADAGRGVAAAPGLAAGWRMGAAGAGRAPRGARPLRAELIAGAVRVDVARAARRFWLTGSGRQRTGRVGAAGEQAGAGSRVARAAAFAACLRLHAHVVHAGEIDRARGSRQAGRRAAAPESAGFVLDGETTANLTAARRPRAERE